MKRMTLEEFMIRRLKRRAMVTERQINRSHIKNAVIDYLNHLPTFNTEIIDIDIPALTTELVEIKIYTKETERGQNGPKL